MFVSGRHDAQCCGTSNSTGRAAAERQSATDLQFLTSFFDRQGIPEALLRSPSRTAGNDNFKDILTARDYSLVTVTKDAHTFGMHNLVQQVTRKWLESQKQFNK